jgi:cytoskeletal protein CcmA (bactofilin family)
LTPPDAICRVVIVLHTRTREALVLRGLRRFFGFDSAEEDELEPSLTTLAPGSSGPPSGAFRVGEKLSIKGEIVGEGDLELAGRFEGIVSVNGRVYVGERAEVDADISASNIVVGGKVRGNLNATGRVEILPQGVLTGNLKSGSFAAADGALVKGEIVVDRGRGRIEVGGGQP